MMCTNDSCNYEYDAMSNNIRIVPYYGTNIKAIHFSKNGSALSELTVLSLLVNLVNLAIIPLVMSSVSSVFTTLYKRILKIMNGLNKRSLITFAIIFCCLFIFSINDAMAIDSNYHVNILNEISETFKTKSALFTSKIQDYAITLFWLLAGISLAWTAIELALKHAEFGEIVGELAKYIIFTGLFSFVLTNGVTIAGYIYHTFAMLGGLAAGLPASPNTIPSLQPSEVIDLGLDFYDQVASTREWDMDTIAMDLISMTIATGFFVLTLIIATKVLIQLINLWCLMYAGAFFLGFGGSRWTQDIARNYFKSVLYASSQFFAMIFLVTIMKMIMKDLMADFNSGSMITIVVFLIIPIIFFMVMESVPGIVAGITTGSFNFSSGAAGSAMLGAAGGFIMGAASAGNMGVKAFTPEPSKGITDSANAGGGSLGQSNTSSDVSSSNSSDNQSSSNSSNNSNKESFIKRMGTSPVGKAIGKTASLGKSALKLSAMGIKATSATAGAAIGAAAHPIQTAKHGLNSGVSGLQKGYSSLKKGASDAKQKAKDFGNSTFKQPFQAGSNFANGNGSGSNGSKANTTSKNASNNDSSSKDSSAKDTSVNNANQGSATSSNSSRNSAS